MFYLFILLIIIIVLSIAYILFRKYIRPKFPVQVTCWFCDHKTSVPYADANSFECPSCEQYNGFNEDGDYNKPLPAQYDTARNSLTPCRPDEYIGGLEVLCERCTQNQLLKTKHLAKFEPYIEANFLEEVTAFEQHIERTYRLCAECEHRVQKELNMQDSVIATRLGRLYAQDMSDQQIGGRDMRHCLDTSVTIFPSGLVWTCDLVAPGLLQCMSLLFAGGLLLCRPDTGQYSLSGQWSLVFHQGLVWLDRHTVVLAAAGLFTWLAGTTIRFKQQRVSIFDVIGCPMWLFLLLIHTGFIPYLAASRAGDLVLNVATALTALICLGQKRTRQDEMDIRVIRSPTASIRSGIKQDCKVRQKATYTEDSENSDVDDSHDISGLTDKLSEVDSWIDNGTGTRKSRKDTGLFTRTSYYKKSVSSTRHLSASRAGPSPGRRRPLISPASFTYKSTPSQHKFGWGSQGSSQNFGLFSATQRSFPQQFVLAGQYKSSQHILPPERLATPVVQSFGTSPYKHVYKVMEQRDKSNLLPSPRSTDIVTEPRDPDSTVGQESILIAEAQCQEAVNGTILRQKNCVEPESSVLGQTSQWLHNIGIENEGTVLNNRAAQSIDSDQSHSVSSRDLWSQVGSEAEGEIVENLVDRFLGLPSLSPKENGLRRSDSGYLSCVSDSDVQVSAVSSSQAEASVEVPRQLIRCATFQYQSALPPAQDTTKPFEPSDLCQEKGWKMLENSKTLLPRRRYLTRFGSAPYRDILQQASERRARLDEIEA